MATVEIQLTRGFVAVIDEADLGLVNRYRWRASQAPNGRVYARASSGGGKTLYMHRLIASPDPGEDVDHVDGDGLNNTRANLRGCTRSENLHNRKVKCPGKTSRFLGVSWHRGQERWIATCRVGGVSHRLGSFRSEEAAAKARDEFARSHCDPFARFNFPSASGDRPILRA